MGCFSGRLMSAASDQKLFCKLCSQFCCSFDEFVEEKVTSPSYSSAILTPPVIYFRKGAYARKRVIVQSLSCVWLWDPMSCSILGFPVHHHLLEFAQTHVHWADDATQASHPLLPPSSPALILSQHQGHFQWVSSLHQVAKVLELQHQCFQWILGLISLTGLISLLSKGLSRVFSGTTVQKHQFFST